jgi:TolB protein
VGTYATRPRFAIPDCAPRTDDAAAREACRTLTQVLRADLEFENLFSFVSAPLMASLPPQSPEAPTMVDWKGVEANYLVTLRAQMSGGEVVADVRVYFVDSGQAIRAGQYRGRADNPRAVAHHVSDDIMALTQYKGVARTRLAFVSDRDGKGKEIYVMDYDGHNVKRVTASGSISSLPAWSPDGRAFAYLSYYRDNPEIFVAHIFEGRRVDITSRQGGANFSPAWSPDGTRLAYASSRGGTGGNVDIWVSAANGSGPRRLTSSPALDTAPCFSPSGREIAFTSDRGGRQQIFVMDDEGLNVRRLVSLISDSPAWSPSRQFAEVAFTSRIEGGFEIAVIGLDTQQVRQISEGRGACEYPSWAPSGRHLVFACRQGGRWQITVADRMGQVVRTLPAGPGNNQYPDWGPTS